MLTSYSRFVFVFHSVVLCVSISAQEKPTLSPSGHDAQSQNTLHLYELFGRQQDKAKSTNRKSDRFIESLVVIGAHVRGEGFPPVLLSARDIVLANPMLRREYEKAQDNERNAFIAAAASAWCDAESSEILTEQDKKTWRTFYSHVIQKALFEWKRVPIEYETRFRRKMIDACLQFAPLKEVGMEIAPKKNEPKPQPVVE